MPRLSLLIPCLRDNRAFEDTLASVLQNRPADSEVLVVHPHEYGDPYGLKGEVCFLQAPKARDVVSLLNAGFEAARSRIIHVVQCGLEVDDGWTEAALQHFDDDSVATVAPVIVDAQDRCKVYSAGLGYSRWGRAFAASAGKRLTADARLSTRIVGPTLSAGFYRRSWWRQVRWDETLGDDFADAQLHLTLARLGASTRLATECRLRAGMPVGLSADEPFGFTTARRAERLFWMHQTAEPSANQVPMRLALYLADSLLALPSPRALTGLLGRLIGLCSRADRNAFQQRLEEITQRLAAEQQSAEATLSFDHALQLRRPRTTAKRQAA